MCVIKVNGQFNLNMDWDVCMRIEEAVDGCGALGLVVWLCQEKAWWWGDSGSLRIDSETMR